MCKYLRMIEEKKLVFCITIFPEQTQNKNKVGIKTTLFINDGKYQKQKALSKFTFVSGGTKGFFFFEKQKTSNKHII